MPVSLLLCVVNRKKSLENTQYACDQLWTDWPLSSLFISSCVLFWGIQTGLQPSTIKIRMGGSGTWPDFVLSRQLCFAAVHKEYKKRDRAFTNLITLILSKKKPLTAPEEAWGTCAVTRRFIQRSSEIAKLSLISREWNVLAWMLSFRIKWPKNLGSLHELMTLNGKRDFSEVNHSYSDL